MNEGAIIWRLERTYFLRSNLSIGIFPLISHPAIAPNPTSVSVSIALFYFLESVPKGYFHFPA